MLKLFFKNTKMIHAGRICAVRALAPILPLALGIVLCIVLPTLIWRLVGLLVGIIFMLVLLIRGGTQSIELGFIAEMLRDQSYDRKYFVLTDAPASRAEWETLLLGRIGELKFEVAESEKSDETAPIAFAAKSTASVGSDSLECFAVLYSVASLDEDAYRAIVSDARRRIRNAPSRDDKKDKARLLNFSYGTAATAVILADAVDASVAILAKENAEIRDGAFCPAVVDCTEGRVYMNGEHHRRASCSADAQRMVGRIVFGMNGQIPREGGEQTDAYRELYETLKAQTYGEFLNESRKTSATLRETEKRLLEELSDGEFRFDDGVLYGVAEGKLMSLCFFPEDESDEPITVPPATAGRVLYYDAELLSWDLPKARDMDARDREIYLPLMLRYVESVGYSVQEESEEA